MSSLVIIGAQWGDEGKGKIVDFLTPRADWVVRFHGGNNAGHTLLVNGVKTKLSLVPSGVLWPASKNLIGAGVVLNPLVLLKEIDELATRGISLGRDRLLIDRDAHLVMGYHIAIDCAREQALGDKKIGTTGRGIGPAYEDRAARVGIRAAQLLALDDLQEALRINIEQKNEYLSLVLKNPERIKFEDEWATLSRAIDRLGPLVANGSLLIDEALAAGQRVVFEGAQGTFLDQTFGTVPFVTSSHTLAGAVATGCGIGPQRINYVLGVTKAYCTRVGSGPFPTELTEAVGDSIRTRGAEFGTVTGRPRRCGWIDAFALRRAVRLNGINSLAVTKLDVLSGLETVRMCVGYKLDGKALDDLPALASELARVEPVYQNLRGWSADISGRREIRNLPQECQAFLAQIAEYVGVPVSLVGVGAERDATVWGNEADYLRSFV